VSVFSGASSPIALLDLIFLFIIVKEGRGGRCMGKHLVYNRNSKSRGMKPLTKANRVEGRPSDFLVWRMRLGFVLHDGRWMGACPVTSQKQPGDRHSGLFEDRALDDADTCRTHGTGPQQVAGEKMSSRAVRE